MSFRDEYRLEHCGSTARDGLSEARPPSLMPGPRLNHISEPPEPGFPSVETSPNESPALAGWQLDDAVNVRGIDVVGFARGPVNQFTAPTAARIQIEHLFDIPAIKDLGVEAPGVVMRRRVWLFHLEPVQRTSVIEMIFGERPRHALDADDPRAVGKPPTKYIPCFPWNCTLPSALGSYLGFIQPDSE